MKTQFNTLKKTICIALTAGTFNASTSSTTVTMNINASAGKLVRVCAVWDKCNTISGSHSSGTIVSPAIEYYTLSVTTPDNKTYVSGNMYDTKSMVSFI